MRKTTLILSIVTVVMLTLSSHTNALTFDQLPTEQSSDQWTVKVGKAGEGKDYVKPQKGKFNTYSLKVDNIGKKVHSIEINMFRNEPKSKTKFSLISCPDGLPCNENHHKTAESLAKEMNNGAPYTFPNFLIAEKATELEVEIVWTNDSNGRPLKETFTFNGK